MMALVMIGCAIVLALIGNVSRQYEQDLAIVQELQDAGVRVSLTEIPASVMVGALSPDQMPLPIRAVVFRHELSVDVLGDRRLDRLGDLKSVEVTSISAFATTDSDELGLHSFSLDNLRSIELVRGKLGQRTCLALASAPNLTRVSLAFSSFPERREAECLEELASIPQLGELSLSHVGPGERMLWSPAGSGTGTLGVRDDSLKALAKCRHLRSLDLSGLWLEGPGLVHLKDIGLRQLKLPPLCSIKAMPSGTSLEDLDISGCALDASGAAALRGQTRLRNLTLEGCKAHPDVLQTLTGFENLGRIDLRGTDATGEVVSALIRGNPDLKEVLVDSLSTDARTELEQSRVGLLILQESD